MRLPATGPAERNSAVIWFERRPPIGGYQSSGGSRAMPSSSRGAGNIAVSLPAQAQAGVPALAKADIGCGVLDRPASRNDDGGVRGKSAGANSIILEQPLDVVELELRPHGLAEALAQLVEDAAGALDVSLERHLHGRVVIVAAVVHLAAERIGAVLGALPAGSTGLSLSVALLPHLLL